MKPNKLLKRIAIAASFAFAILTQPLRASIAYGSINNFDTVNDTGHECHGFEIEIEDCHSTDITYTYDYNHYGTCKITQDDSIPGHPKTVIRWASKKNPDGSWASYTAIPSGPINPTDGHQFTNPSVNFGGEHFGVGYSAPVGAIRYCWLIDDGAGNLISGGPVQVSTPSYVYYPPFNGAPAQVQAVIDPPEPDVPDPLEFGKAVWVKEIRTTSHNNGEVKLRDLVSDDPDKEDEKNWKNGEPDEVETEWQILQKDYGKADGGPNNDVPAAPEDLPDGDEVVTRRYEFFKYIGPIDAESGEAMADAVGPDGIHGEGTKVINGEEVDLSTIEVVGEFTGSQMAAVDVDAPVALIDHVSEASENEAFAARSLVVPGSLPYICIKDGELPVGMEFDETTGVLSGTPTETGEFLFTVTASDGFNADVSKNYTLLVAEAGAALPPTSIVDTVAAPIDAGITSGDGAFDPGSPVTVTASPMPGFRFVNWTDNGNIVATTETYTFNIDVNHSLIANFTVDVPQWTVTTSGFPVQGGTTSDGGLFDEGTQVSVTATPNVGYVFTNWTENGAMVSTSATYTFSLTQDRNLIANFGIAPSYVIGVSSNPSAGGTTSGGGSHVSGTSATVIATANPGYVFTQWTSGGNQVSTSPSYTFTVTSNRNLVANFILSGIQRTIAASSSPAAWGSVAGAGTYGSGEVATLTAIPNPGYAFSKWREGNTNVSTSATYSFTVTADRTLTAVFIEAFVISTNSSPSNGGTTEMDSVTYKTGENAKAQANPANGFTFANWTENGVIVSTDENYNFDVTGNRSLVANFVSDAGITVNADCEPSHGGSVLGDDVYDFGDDVTVSVVANNGFVFSNWTENGAVVSTDPAFGFSAVANVALVAHFVPSVSITASASPPEGGVVEGSGEYAGGSQVGLTAVANPGYAFNGWTENSAGIDSGSDFSFIAGSARTLVANFIALPALTAVVADPGSNELIVSWPAANAGWILEESSNLATWTVSTRQVVVEAGQNKVTVPVSGAGMYFRLSHP